MSDYQHITIAIGYMADYEFPAVKTSVTVAMLYGTAAMRAAGDTLLPRWSNEEAESFKTCLAVATLFPAFPHTIEVLAGKPFSKPLTLSDDVPST